MYLINIYRRYKDLWRIRKVRKICRTCKHHIADYDYHDECISHRDCFNADDRLLSSVGCAACDCMLEAEHKIIGDGGASVSDTNDLKWGQVLGNALRQLRVIIEKKTGVKPSLTKDSILSAEDLVRWRELKSLNSRAGQWRLKVVDNPKVGKLVAKNIQTVGSDRETASGPRPKSTASDISLDIIVPERNQSDISSDIIAPELSKVPRHGKGKGLISGGPPAVGLPRGLQLEGLELDELIIKRQSAKRLAMAGPSLFLSSPIGVSVFGIRF